MEFNNFFVCCINWETRTHFDSWPVCRAVSQVQRLSVAIENKMLKSELIARIKSNKDNDNVFTVIKIMKL